MLLVDKEILIIVDDYVDMEFGIGVVKIIFVYDLNDFEVGNCYDLFWVNVMNEDGMMNELVGKYEGMDCFVVCKVIVFDLKELGCLIKIEIMNYSVGYLEWIGVVVELCLLI